MLPVSKTQWSRSKPWKWFLLLYRHQLWQLWKIRQIRLILINHANQCKRDSISLFGVGYLHNQNLGIWCMKPGYTKHPEINGAPFLLALYDGGINVILFFWKILEWGAEAEDYSLRIITFASTVSKYVTSRWISMTCNFSVDVHGLTKIN